MYFVDSGVSLCRGDSKFNIAGLPPFLADSARWLYVDKEKNFNALDDVGKLTKAG